MEAASVPPQEQPPEQLEQATLIALTALLLAPNPVVLMDQAVSVLSAVVPVEAAKLAAGFVLAAPLEGVPEGVAPATAAHWVGRTAVPRRAAYLVSAARRLSEADTPAGRQELLEVERRYLAQHQQAEAHRRDAAVRVDAAVEQHGPVLGWHARNDERTTPACRAAHGSNFGADRPPTLPTTEDGGVIVGYPGQPHGGSCRCVPGPAWPDGRMLN